MSTDRTTLILGIWGTTAGSVALLIQLLSFLADRSRLLVEATFSYGVDRRLRPEGGYALKLRLMNKGRRLIRIDSVSLELSSPKQLFWNAILRKLGARRDFLQEGIGIYSASVNPIDDIAQMPNVKTYPPANVTLEEHQTVELDLAVDEQLIQALPPSQAYAIVRDHVGRKYRARFYPFLKHEEEQDSQQVGRTNSGSAAAAPE